jgi:hypothetical protein
VALFASQLQEEVLVEVPHRQYVFTIHKLLRQHFRFDHHLLGILSLCAHHSVLEMMRAVVSDPVAVPGMVASIQTYGDCAAALADAGARLSEQHSEARHVSRLD